MTSTVPGRDVSDRYPGTSCLATISLSLRDKSIRPSKRHTIILALMLPTQHPSTPALQYPNTAALQYGNPGAELKQGADLSFGVANRLCGERPGQKPIQVII